MQRIKEEHQQISTILSFALIPLSGFATDIYIISKSLMRKFLTKKNTIAFTLQRVFAINMIVAGGYLSSLYSMRPFWLSIHLFSGFLFYNLFAYCLERFSKNAGIARGITGGLMYVLTSVFSHSLVDLIDNKNMVYRAWLTCTCNAD